MDVSVKNLVSRNGKYYFRCRCPAGMRGDDMREIKISLKTSDLKKAVSVCKLITGKLNHLIESGAANTMTLDEIRRIWKSMRGKWLITGQSVPIPAGKVCDAH